MSSFKNFVGGVLSFLVIVGIIKGLGASDLTGGDSIGDIALHIINGVADLTVLLIPTVIDAISSLTGSVASPE